MSSFEPISPVEVEADDILSRELPWPKKGDRLFSEKAANWQEVAMLDPYARGLWIRIFGFKRAADVMVEQGIQHRSDLNFLIYPIVFNYRHYLELALKELVMTVRRAERDQRPMPTHHRLTPLWDEVRAYALEHGSGEDRESLMAVDSVVREFDRVDPGSMTFRYGVGKSGEQLLPDDMSRIDVRNLAEVMHGTGTFIESYADMLGDALELIDSESDWR